MCSSKHLHTTSTGPESERICRVNSILVNGGKFKLVSRAQNYNPPLKLRKTLVMVTNFSI